VRAFAVFVGLLVPCGVVGALAAAACSPRPLLDDEDTGVVGPKDAKADSTVSDGSSSDAPIGEGGMDAGSSFSFMVVRVGKADAGLTTAAAPVALEERRSTDGMLIRTIAMPIAADAGGAPLTLGGTAATEGALATSGNGKYVVLAGYGAAPGIAGISTSSAVTYKRIVATVDKAGAIDTTTKLQVFSATAVRGATSDDGTAFWTVGGTTGVIYATLGATSGTTISTTSTNNRAIQIVGGQLYGSTVTGNYRVFTVGTGLPTTAGQVAANLAGVTGNMPNGFSLADLSMVTGVDTLYVADERASPNGGVQRWTSNGATWSLVTTFNADLSAGCSNVLAVKVGSNAHVICASLEAPSRLVRYVDDGMNMTPTATVLATADPGTAYRGVALSPQ
jgi:hypothetical protein